MAVLYITGNHGRDSNKNVVVRYIIDDDD